MSKQPKPFVKTKPQRSENSLFGLELPRKYRPFLIILIILLALAGTWLASQQKMRSLQERFSAGTPVPAQSAPDSIGNNATPSPAEAPGTETSPLESNVFEPGSADYYLYEAILLYHQQNFNQALENLLIAQEKAPENEVVYFNLGATLAQLGRIPEAEEAYLRALEILPRYAEAHNNLGRILLNKNELEKAQAHFNKAIEAAPRHAPAYNNLGIVLVRLQQSAQAEKEFLSAVEINPDYTEAYVNLGYLYLTTLNPGDSAHLTKAEECFRNALRVSPGFEPALKGLEALDRAQAPELLSRPPE